MKRRILFPLIAILAIAVLSPVVMNLLSRQPAVAAGASEPASGPEASSVIMPPPGSAPASAPTAGNAPGQTPGQVAKQPHPNLLAQAATPGPVPGGFGAATPSPQATAGAGVPSSAGGASAPSPQSGAPSGVGGGLLAQVPASRLPGTGLRPISALVQGADLTNPRMRARVVADVADLQRRQKEEAWKRADLKGLPKIMRDGRGRTAELMQFEGDKPIY